MTIENLTINWLSRYAGINDCFAFDAVNYNDPDGIPRIGSTADVLNAFFVAHLIGKDNINIISETNYSQLKVVNKNQDITLDDVSYVYSITDYCYIDCLEITCPNICIDYDLYSQKCENDTCSIDQLIETNNVNICGYDPCIGIVCEPFCDGFDYYTSECINGECIDVLVETNSVEHCGYEPPIEPKKAATPWWLLGFLLLLKGDDDDKK